MLSLAKRLVRRLNWARRGWSTASDRLFHDSIFAGQDYNPFSSSYPGYLTIRRFADLAEPHIRPSAEVLDLGCGPAEITCELARRRPDARFLAIDHSAEALARAHRLASDLRLDNIRFERDDLEEYEPRRRTDVVLMFDAFHHVLDPAGFVARVGRWSDRFFLIEPGGDWLGRWNKGLDLDWIAEALFTVRDRLEYQFDLRAETRGGSAPAEEDGQPIEHRYTLDDYARWFDGFGLDVSGTVAGLERYGTSPYAASPLRDDIGRAAYNLTVDLEAALRRADLDLAAKHWAIYAERGRVFPPRRVPGLPAGAVEAPLAGPYGCEYGHYSGPREAPRDAVLHAEVHVSNTGWRTWDSRNDTEPVLLSYHWLDPAGAMVVEDGLRSPLPRPIPAGDGATVAFRVCCPPTPGRYALAVDLVHERVTWFSGAGVPMLRVPMRIV